MDGNSSRARTFPYGADMATLLQTDNEVDMIAGMPRLQTVTETDSEIQVTKEKEAARIFRLQLDTS